MNDEKYYKYISNFNFDNVEDFEGQRPKYIDMRYGYHREGNNIIFEATYLACPCIYYIQKDGLFCFSFEVNHIIDFCNENNIELQPGKLPDIDFDSIKPSIRKRYTYDIPAIEGWKKVTLHSDGSFEVEKNELQPFQLSVRDNYDKFKAFLLKYKHAIDAAIDDGYYIPTLTGGMDSRTLLGYILDRIDDLPSKNYHLRATKDDGKHNSAKGKSEMIIAARVARHIGLEGRVEDLPENAITSSGILNENGLYTGRSNNLDYIYKYCQHSYSSEKCYKRSFTPYIDDDYLIFKHDRKCQMKALLALLLIPNLLNIKTIGSTAQFNNFNDGYSFVYAFYDELASAQEILDYWGEEKCKNILKED